MGPAVPHIPSHCERAKGAKQSDPRGHHEASGTSGRNHPGGGLSQFIPGAAQGISFYINMID